MLTNAPPRQATYNASNCSAYDPASLCSRALRHAKKAAWRRVLSVASAVPIGMPSRRWMAASNRIRISSGNVLLAEHRDGRLIARQRSGRQRLEDVAEE